MGPIRPSAGHVTLKRCRLRPFTPRAFTPQPLPMLVGGGGGGGGMSPLTRSSRRFASAAASNPSEAPVATIVTMVSPDPFAHPTETAPPLAHPSHPFPKSFSPVKPSAASARETRVLHASQEMERPSERVES